MKIWMGPEQEGLNRGDMTLFVQAEHITKEDSKMIFTLLEKHKINRLYLGAGRVNLKSFENAEAFITMCLFVNVTVITEIGIQEDMVIIEPFASNGELVFTIRNKNIPVGPLTRRGKPNASFKMDNYKALFIAPIEHGHTRQLIDVENNRYNNLDVVVYDSEEIEK